MTQRDQGIAEPTEVQLREAYKEMELVFGDRNQHLLWQLGWWAAHPFVLFDVTFYQHEPILEATMDQRFAHKFNTALRFPIPESREATIRFTQRLKSHGISHKLWQLTQRIELASTAAQPCGVEINADDIWTLNFMPRDLNPSDTVDEASAASKIGLKGETLREMISNSYHCKSRAEEDWFICRWIAS